MARADGKDGKSGAITALIAAVAFAALSAYCAIRSDAFLEADGITHYLYARFALTETHYLINIWGRPICTGIYALPAHFYGLLGVRFTSLTLALSLALVTWLIAKNQKHRWPALAVVFVLGQPLVFLHSFSELTELPFALILAVAFLGYQKRWWWLLALAAGLLPLGRPEGFGFIALASLALLLHRKPHWIPLVFLPLVAWDYVGWREYGSVGPWYGWLGANWPWGSESVYTPGSTFHYLMLLPAIVPPLAFPAFCAGVAVCVGALLPKSEEAEDYSDHRQRCEALIVFVPLLILVVHSLLYKFGKMASSGEMRYMLIVGTFWSLLCARGWAWAFEHFRWRGVYLAVCVAAILPAGANYFYKVVPITSEHDQGWARARRAVDYIHHTAEPAGYARVALCDPTMNYLLDRSMTGSVVTMEWTREKLLHEPLPKNTVVIWHPMYAIFNADPKRVITADNLLKAGWSEDVAAGESLGGAPAERWRIFKSGPTK